ncbi:Ninja-family protein AFP3 [Striga hermonthica]|uniref:Ninja-family protein n=1 Tax=Striga hermonthica TaxID=68872 RepID=A0A9N7RFJ2_STRHE|nr:Ninja-family protein AFP3 [Striga hermonthica]
MEEAEGSSKKLDLLFKLAKTQSECPNEDKRQGEQEGGGRGEDEDEVMELSLGLSTNGRFGVDPTRSKKLKRASSIADAAAFAVGTGARVAGTEAHAPPLSRTRSLPVETEEEWRRRKELQSIRRMEARKKRMEKMKNLRLPRDANGGKNGLQHEPVNGDSIGQRLLGNGVLRRFENREVVESSSQGSAGPMRSGSSASSDLIEGRKQNAEVSPSSKQSSNGPGPGPEPEPMGRASETEAKGATTSQQLKNTMRDMPYVTTKETGPNGRRVEGFLYGYKKGEDVRIMCVCHGIFLTPKEFVEHGGVRGADVEHPLKHIVVNPFPLL